MDREGRETVVGVASLPPDYWDAFHANFQAKLKLLEWVPFQAVKIFKIGLHWVTVYRPSLSAVTIQYWVQRTWQAALHIANEVASTVRTEFTHCYAQPF